MNPKLAAWLNKIAGQPEPFPATSGFNAYPQTGGGFPATDTVADTQDMPTAQGDAMAGTGGAAPKALGDIKIKNVGQSPVSKGNAPIGLPKVARAYTKKEKRDIQHFENSWKPDPLHDVSDPAASALFSPAAAATYTGLGYGALGATFGGLMGADSGHAGLGAVIGGAGLGLFGAWLAYKAQQAQNKETKEDIKWLKPNANFGRLFIKRYNPSKEFIKQHQLLKNAASLGSVLKTINNNKLIAGSSALTAAIGAHNYFNAPTAGNIIQPVGNRPFETYLAKDPRTGEATPGFKLLWTRPLDIELTKDGVKAIIPDKASQPASEADYKAIADKGIKIERISDDAQSHYQPISNTLTAGPNRMVTLHETTHALDKDNISPFIFTARQTRRRMADSETPAMITEMKEAIRQGHRPSYDLWTKQINRYGPELTGKPTDVESIDSWLKKFRGNTELGRRYKDWLKAQGGDK